MSVACDHVVPLSKGGRDDLKNVKPSHGKCNLTKSSNPSRGGI